MSVVPEFNLRRPDPKLAALLAEYPAELFNDRLFQSIEWADRYSLDLAIHLLQRLGVLARLDNWRSVRELSRDLEFSPRFDAALIWLLERLLASDEVAVQERNGIRHYRGNGDPGRPALEALREMGLAIDPANRATLDLLDAAAEVYPAVARGECSGEEALFGSGRADLWLAYFHNDNPLYAINNWFSAVAAARRMAGRSRLRILEIGAGGGSGTEALLRTLAKHDGCGRIERYMVTEPSPFFRRRCERSLKRAYRDLPIEFGALDIDKPWDVQGVAREGFDLVCGVNVLHVAKDLAFSLGQAKAALAADGWLVAGECMRPFPGQTIHIELVFQILDSFTNVKTDPGHRSNPGFITPEQWERSLGHAGFGSVEIVPDYRRVRDIYPRFYIGAVCGH